MKSQKKTEKSPTSFYDKNVQPKNRKNLPQSDKEHLQKPYI